MSVPRLPLLNRAGATMVVVAVMILMFLSMAALAIDYGMVKTTKAEAQRAMDASALAGASAFITSDPAFSIPDSAVRRAKDIAAEHLVHRVFVDTITAHNLMNVVVDMGARTVTASYNVPPISLWFARRFGSSTMGLQATAVARASQTGNATCVKPVAIPDIWNNVDPGLAEDNNGNHLWDYQDQDGNGKWDDGETEPWKWTPGDVYDSASTGYGSTFRNSYGTGYQIKTKDYGRQMVLTTFSPKDASISSMYYSWGENTDQTNADSVAARIRGESCVGANVQTPYKAANGGKIGPLQAAWADLIDTDPAAHWDDGSNTVVGSNAPGGDWQNQSKRVVVVGLYDPSKYSAVPSGNDIKFINLAKVWIDERPCAGPPGACKSPITGRFLGFLGGGPSGPNIGTLVWRIALIK